MFFLAGCLAVLLLAGLAGCAPPTVGDLTIQSSAADAAGARIDARFQTIIYRKRDDNSATIVLSDIERPRLVTGEYTEGQVLVIDMFVRPKAGATPIDRTATNATFRHVILAGEDVVGVYGGGGFFFPTSSVPSEGLGGEVFHASLQHIASSEGFVDRLKTVVIQGRLLAERADEAVARIAYQLNTEVSRRLGRVYFVMND